MNLLRDGNVVDEATYIKTTEAMNRMQGVADRIVMKSPELNRCTSLKIFIDCRKIQISQEKVF